MQKYVLVAFFGDVEPGFEFSAAEWPLHVTIVPRFAVDIENTDVMEDLKKVFDNSGQMTLEAEDDEFFGPKNDIKVTLLKLIPELLALHTKAMRVLKAAGAHFDDPEHSLDGYRPHITVQEQGRVNKADTVTLIDVSLIDMFPNADIHRRKVLKKFILPV